jgi:hypothetical protein
LVAKRNQFIGELLHVVGARLRVTGTGNLRTSLHSLDGVRSNQLVNIAMQTTTNREPTILSNFQEQRVQLKIETMEENEFFRISRIIVFIKPVAESYPI